MSDVFWGAFFGAMPATIAALAALVSALRTSRKVEEVRHATNSLTDRLVATTGREQHAAGKLEGESMVRRPPAPGSQQERFGK
jgi:hypothetical protein